MTSAAIDDIRRDVLGWVPPEHLTPMTVADVEKRFREFSVAWQHNDIRALLRATTHVHHVVANLVGDEAAQLTCDRLQQLIPATIASAAHPLETKTINFVWIGSIGAAALRTIAIWQKANPAFRVQLWFDSHCLLAGHYMHLLKDRSALGLATNDDLIRFQNRIYAGIQSRMASGSSFDEALIDLFSNLRDGAIGRDLTGEQQRVRRLYAAIAGLVDLHDVQHHASEIMDDEFRRYYFREIALRANLAAASDILRLHVLDRYGGIYVDVDTLPSLDHVYPRTLAHCRENGISFGFVDVLKSELYLRKIAPLIDFPGIDVDTSEPPSRREDMQEITDHLRQHLDEVVALIEEEASQLTGENAFKPLADIRLCRDGLLLSGDPHAKNCFNNNIVIANPQSRTIGIILREMRRRYRFLERSGAVGIASQSQLPHDAQYDGRLLNYRYDALDDQPNVTVILTGPGLIFECLMGMGFSLLKLDDDVQPASLAYALYAPRIGISFMDQTFYTYDHSRSSWMRGPEGALLV